MPTIPTATSTDGMVSYKFVPTIASTSAPTVAEITAGVELACWITDDGWQPSLNETAASDKRACAAQERLSRLHLDHACGPDAGMAGVREKNAIVGQRSCDFLRQTLGADWPRIRVAGFVALLAPFLDEAGNDRAPLGLGYSSTFPVFASRRPRKPRE